MKKSIFTAGLVIFLFVGIYPTQAIIPNDTDFVKQQSMWESVNALSAWDIATGTKKTVVAIIDTGVDTWHPDLDNNIWVNQFEIENNGVDDDHNGYIDDIHGWNFIEKNNDVRTSVFNTEDIPEAVRHGTVAAGLVGAVGNNARAGTGVNWSVSIMPLRAVSNNGYGSMSVVGEAILYAVNNGADVISLSMVSAFADSGFRQALRVAYEQGVVIVAAAGNRHNDLTIKPNYPICYDSNDSENWIIGVGALASTTSDQLAYFSDYGNCIDILAPGSGIYSTERYAPAYGYLDAFGGPWEGTSFAAPIVAGAVALLKSIHPEWTPAKIISVLQSTADNVDSANSSLIGKLGSGRVNIGHAVERAARETSFRGVDLRRLYYIQDEKLLIRLDIDDNKNYVLANTEEAKILDLARMGNRPGGREYLAALIKREKFYYVKFFDGNGVLLGEKALAPVTDKNAIAEKIVWRGENLAVGYVNKKTKTSYVADYDLDGLKLRELKIKNLVEWEGEPRTGYLVAVMSDAKTFKWQLYDNVNKIVNAGKWRGYKTVEDLRLGYFWGETELQIAAMLKTNKKTDWQIIDTQSKRLVTEILPQKTGRYMMLPGLYLEQPGFFVYAVGASEYRIYNGRAELLRGGKF